MTLEDGNRLLLKVKLVPGMTQTADIRLQAKPRNGLVRTIPPSLRGTPSASRPLTFRRFATDRTPHNRQNWIRVRRPARLLAG